MQKDRRRTVAALALSVTMLAAGGCKCLAVGDNAAGGSGDVAPDEQTATPGEARQRADWATYADSAHGFRLDHPPGFVVRSKDGTERARSTPTPVAWVLFMNPTMAAGDLAGMEPPDLELRVFQAAGSDSLRSWLEAAGFAGGQSGAVAGPFRTAGIEGLEVCQTTLIAPGCSVYFLRGDRVHQLTANSAEGETMLGTLVLQP